MSTVRYFTAINGQPVELKNVAYAEINKQLQKPWDKAEPSETGTNSTQCKFEGDRYDP